MTKYHYCFRNRVALMRYCRQWCLWMSRPNLHREKLVWTRELDCVLRLRSDASSVLPAEYPLISGHRLQQFM